MRVLLINKYLYRRGGAEAQVLDEASILSEHGHQVAFFSMRHPNNIRTPYDEYFVSGVDFGAGAVRDKLRAVGRLFYSLEARKRLRKLLNEFAPDIVHLNNIAHQLSPSILDELNAREIPVVMTFHDYKIVCPSYTLLSKGKVCERCRERRFYHAIVQGCHKGSRLASALVAAEMTVHHVLLDIYSHVKIFISPSRFLKDKITEMGWRGDVRYLPNFVFVRDYPAPRYGWEGAEILYVGRISHEKGVRSVCDAVKDMPVALSIVGDGPERWDLEAYVKERGIDNIRFLGWQDAGTVQRMMERSMFVVVPSLWYENSPRAILEAFAMGKPVIGADIGGIPELVRDGETGLLFEPGNVEELRSKMAWLIAHRDRIVAFGRTARAYVEHEFSEAPHYSGLMTIYSQAIGA